MGFERWDCMSLLTGDAMTERTARLRKVSLDAVPSISHERASLITDFTRRMMAKFSAGDAGQVVRVPLRAQDHLHWRRGDDRRRARTDPKGRAYLS